MTLFAQGEIAGWVTAATSVGLLGPVLYWLCYHHLPAKDTQIERILALNDAKVLVKDAQIERLFAESAAERERDQERLRAQAKEFKEALNAILAHCRDENNRLTEVFKAELQKVVDAK